MANVDVLNAVRITYSSKKRGAEVIFETVPDGVCAQYSKNDLKQIGQGHLRRGIQLVREQMAATERIAGQPVPFAEILPENK